MGVGILALYVDMFFASSSLRIFFLSLSSLSLSLSLSTRICVRVSVRTYTLSVCVWVCACVGIFLSLSSMGVSAGMVSVCVGLYPLSLSLSLSEYTSLSIYVLICFLPRSLLFWRVEERFCSCRGPEYGEMICCDDCGECYHLECLYMTEIPVGTWLCILCVCNETRRSISAQFKRTEEHVQHMQDDVLPPPRRRLRRQKQTDQQ